jgi:beta-mannanase
MTHDTTRQKKKFVMGLHDPNQLLTSDPYISVEHVFVDFGQIQSGELKRITDEVFSRNHDVILTVEPWKDLSGIPDTIVLDNVVNGKYDSIIQKIFNDVSDTGHIVYLRFAHEMEIPITRYAWQSQDPVTYIKAFRHFMNLAQPFPANVKRIWGPAGDRASLDFYPGDDVVDYVSIAIYGLPDKNITDPNKQESFATIFNRKKWRFRQINKPFFITEFGVKGPEEYQTAWLEEAAKTLNKNPRVIGINYFNMSDTPGAWGEIKAPDWSITPASLHKFMGILERDSL